MNKLVHGIDKDFTVVSNQILKDTKLSFKAKGLLITIISLPSNWDFSVAGLAQISTEKERAIKTGILELVEGHYLRWDKMHDERGRFTVVVTTMLPDVLPRDKMSRGKMPRGKMVDNKELKNKELKNKELKNKIGMLNASPVSDEPTRPGVLKSQFDELIHSLGLSERTAATPGRLNKLRLRVKRMGWESVKSAAENLAGDAWMQGENPSGKCYGGIDYLLRNDENIDKWNQDNVGAVQLVRQEEWV